MAGLGKYKKGAKFTLKSGNKPAFKVMGSSPANLNNFGIGPGGSPWKEGETDDATTDPNANTNEEESKKKGNDVDEQGGEAEKADKGWVKALKIGTTLLSGGIQGVYGGKREYPKINWGKKAEEPTETPEEKVDKALDPDKTIINNENKIVNGEESSSTTYEIQSGDRLSQIAKDNNTTVDELMKKNPQITNKNMIISGETLNL